MVLQHWLLLLLLLLVETLQAPWQCAAKGLVFRSFRHNGSSSNTSSCICDKSCRRLQISCSWLTTRCVLNLSLVRQPYTKADAIAAAVVSLKKNSSRFHTRLPGSLHQQPRLRPGLRCVSDALLDATDHTTSSTSHSTLSNGASTTNSCHDYSSKWGPLPEEALEVRRPLKFKPKKRRGRQRISRSLADLLATQHTTLSGAAAVAASAAAAAREWSAGDATTRAAAAAMAATEGAGSFYASLPSLPLPERGFGRLRVTGGTLARRRLLMPRTDTTRPMMAQVREAVFSMLQSLGIFACSNLRVLDLFCGSGALAIESLSRGAQQAVLVDRSLDCCEAAAVNLRHLGCTESRVLRLCVFELLLSPRRFLGGPDTSSDSGSGSSDAAPFDLIFLCPPYTEVIYADLLKKLLFSGLLRPGGILVVEYPKEMGNLPLKIGFPGAPMELEGLRSRKYGRTCIALYWGRLRDQGQERGSPHFSPYVAAPEEFEEPLARKRKLKKEVAAVPPIAEKKTELS
ncbi:hypothetical protein, conserved [Eimeria necatrix]|uniref:N6-adenine-specific methylase n=1 Tax=Eimeria necatrix TaxID=51315 RepID=U6MMA4_9EIME|nr:hypothetical protein, conserved [Eimeria necatrix]CDJ63569.1 hypothetical protein, conserved [Eimeria necatrix]